MIEFEYRFKRIAAIAFSFVLFLFFVDSSALAQNTPGNLDFETLDPNGNHIGPPWFIGQNQPSYEVSVDSNRAYHGKYWAHIRSICSPSEKEFANLMQSFDATPYLGRFIKYRAAARHIGNVHGDARLWMRVDRAGKNVFFPQKPTGRSNLPIGKNIK